MSQLVAILFVLAVLWGIVMLLQKRGLAIVNSSLRSRKQTSILQQLDKMRLTPQHSIHLLRIDSRTVLIAVHPQGVTVLEERRP